MIKYIYVLLIFTQIAYAYPENEAVQNQQDSVKSQISFSFADRYYIYSVLKNIFGQSSQAILRDNILKNGNIFGGPCDIYEQIRVEPEQYLNSEETRCFNGKHEYAYPMRRSPSLLREAWMLKTCNLLIKNKITWNFARSQVNTKISNTEKYLDEVQLLFDPNAEKNKEFNKVLLEKVKLIKSIDKKEKFIFYQNCLFPSWQVI